MTFGSSGRLRPGVAWLLVLPCIGFLAAFFIYPMFDIVIRSIQGPTGLTTDRYLRVFTRPVYLQVFLITFEISFTVTVLSLALGYPLAYSLTAAKGRIRGLLTILVLIPFFTDVLVRTYAWMVILGPNGLLNQGLHLIGLGPTKLLYNRWGVLIGMTYAMLPYMVLALYSVMRGIDERLSQAARNLGAGDVQVFWRIFLPLSMPGVLGGGLLVFVLSVGYFVTPRLMGGDRDQMIGVVIAQQVELAVDWGFAAALSVSLLVVTIVGFLVYSRVTRLHGLNSHTAPENVAA